MPEVDVMIKFHYISYSQDWVLNKRHFDVRVFITVNYAAGNTRDSLTSTIRKSCKLGYKIFPPSKWD